MLRYVTECMMGLSGAERQARWRAKRQAELEALRQTGGSDEQLRAALRRCRELEALLDTMRQHYREERRHDREELQDYKQAHPRGELVIAAEIYRYVRAALHPDRVTDPAAKEYLHTQFVRFSELVERLNKAAGGDGAISVEELLRRREETRRKARERAQQAAAKRKANRAGKG